MTLLIVAIIAKGRPAAPKPTKAVKKATKAGTKKPVKEGFFRRKEKPKETPKQTEDGEKPIAVF